MEKHIRLLDCTLRDGGHINQGVFGENVIKQTIKRLVNAGIDLIEVGFLWDSENDVNTARYLTIEDVKRVLPDNLGKSKVCLMADFIDLSKLEPYDGTVEYIRLSFKRWRLDWALKTAKILIEKGYKVFINPVNNNVYSDKEYIEVLEKVNKLHPYAFSIVDTFGVMRVSELSHRYFLVENNLDKDITIGVHLHENLGLAYSLAQHMTDIASPKRNIVIDCSLSGMGREPGNLCTEQIADFLNNQFGENYDMEPIYDAIDDYIYPIKKQHPWGYAIPYALSAKFNLHRTYAEYLINKKRLKTKDIQRILSKIPMEEAETFNEKYVENLYLDYQNVLYDDKVDMLKLKKNLANYNRFVILSPGENLKMANKVIKDFVTEKTCIISVNFIPNLPNVDVDFVFLTNTKRYDLIKENLKRSKLIMTSNLLRDVKESDYTIGYNDLAYFDSQYCDDSTLMLLNLLKRLQVDEVFFLGFDGEKQGKINFYDNSFDRNKYDAKNSDIIKYILSTYFSDIKKHFLTESEYTNC